MTLATALEHQRLTHRAQRIEQVLAALHERRGERSGRGTPAALEQSISEFAGELSRLRTRPDAFASDGVSAR